MGGYAHHPGDQLLKDRLRELVKKVPLLGKAYTQRDELRKTLNELWEPPGHFYSPIPSLEEIRRSEAKVFATDARELGGIGLNEGSQLALWEALTRYYPEQPFAEQKQPGLRYFFENPAFGHFDAIVLYAMIRHARPRRVIEVGSGYSSCVLLDTNELFHGNGISCTFVEPYPELLLSLIKPEDRSRISIRAKNLQDVDPEVFSTLADGDILFIDSSHVSKTHSDVNYVFFEILPRLQDGVHVHFHDIFHP